MSDLTILLITKNRYNFLKRWLDFANSNKFQINIFIADGSSKHEYENSKFKLSDYKNLKVQYKKYSEDKSYSDLYNKVVDALTHIKTIYTVWADDDDFFFENGLNESVNFLNLNIEYSSCRSLTGDFDIVDNKLNINSKVSKYGKLTNFSIHNYPVFTNQISYENHDLFKRLESYTNQKNVTWYDVHRTEHMIFSWKIIKKCNFKNILLAECCLDFLNVISGKIKRFSKITDKLYLLRQYPPKESVARNFRAKRGDTLDQFFQDSWSKDYNLFINTIASLIKTNSKLDYEFCRDFTIKCFRNYYKQSIYKALDKSKIKNNKINGNLIIVYKYIFKILLYKNIIISKFSKNNKINDYLMFNNFFK